MLYEDLTKYNFFFKKICQEKNKTKLLIQLMPDFIYVEYENDNIKFSEPRFINSVDVTAMQEYFEYDGANYNKPRLSLIQTEIDKLTLSDLQQFCSGSLTCIQCKTSYDKTLRCDKCGLRFGSANGDFITSFFSIWPYQYDYEYSEQSKKMLAEDIKTKEEWIEYYALLYINATLVETAIDNNFSKKPVEKKSFIMRSIEKKLAPNNDLLLLNSITTDIKAEYSQSVSSLIEGNSLSKLLRILLTIIPAIALIFSMRISWDKSPDAIKGILKKCMIPIILMIIGILFLKSRLGFNIIIILALCVVIYNFFLLEDSTPAITIAIMTLVLTIIILIILNIWYTIYTKKTKNKASAIIKFLKSGLMFLLFIPLFFIINIYVSPIYSINGDTSDIVAFNLIIGLICLVIMTVIFAIFWKNHVTFSNLRNSTTKYWKYLIPESKEDKLTLVGLIFIIIPSIITSSPTILRILTILISVPVISAGIPGYNMLTYNKTNAPSSPEILRYKDITELKATEILNKDIAELNQIKTKSPTFGKTSQRLALPAEEIVVPDILANKHNVVPKFSRNNILWPTKIVPSMDIPGMDILSNTEPIDNPEIIESPIPTMITSETIASDEEEDVILPESANDVAPTSSEATLETTDVPENSNNLTLRREKDIRELRVERWPGFRGRVANMLNINRGLFN
jgi:hypothetical protein